MALSGSKTVQNLKDAFSGESQANRRYLYFAQKADVEGYNDVAAVFRSTAEGETGHAHGHLEYLAEVGDPATGKPIGATSKNLAAAIARMMAGPNSAAAGPAPVTVRRKFRRLSEIASEISWGLRAFRSARRISHYTTYSSYCFPRTLSHGTSIT